MSDEKAGAAPPDTRAAALDGPALDPGLAGAAEAAPGAGTEPKAKGKKRRGVIRWIVLAAVIIVLALAGLRAVS
ncbi:MAG: hypothetical protein LBS32_05345, partial [Clostridiales Family XIII bacterium]|nr:hypothetical protein [Clostridiales Family XIII bacterium]